MCCVSCGGSVSCGGNEYIYKYLHTIRIVWIFWRPFPPVRRTTHLDEPGGTIRQTRQLLSVTTNGAVERLRVEGTASERGVFILHSMYTYIYQSNIYIYILGIVYSIDIFSLDLSIESGE